MDHSLAGLVASTVASNAQASRRSGKSSETPSVLKSLRGTIRTSDAFETLRTQRVPTWKRPPCSREDSPASLFPLPDSDARKQMLVGSGRRCGPLLRSSDRLSSLLKLCLAFSLPGTTRYAMIWKAKRTPSGRLLFQLVPLGVRISAIGSGFLPTPRACEWQKGGLRSAEARRDSPCLRAWFHLVTGNPLPISFLEWMMGYPSGYTEVKNGVRPSATPSCHKSRKPLPG